MSKSTALELQQDQIALEQGFCHRKAFVRPIRRCGPVLFCPYSKSQARDRQAKPIAVATECIELLDIAVINVEFAELRLVDQPQLHVYLVLYFCSGQRRPDDFQDHFEQLNLTANLPIIVLSIDVVNDVKLGDLTNADTIAFWINNCLNGIIAAILGSPPCETWCAGRFNQLLDGKPGPRPLRSITQPWGVNGLTRREQRQIDLGNALLRTQLLFMHIGAVCNIPVVSEHPAPAHWLPQAPSNWFLQEVSWLFDEGIADRNLVHQCMLGAKALKPTILAAVQLGQLKHNIQLLPNQGLCDKSHQHVKLKGRDADGNFVTAPFKQYQSPLNFLLAKSFMDKLQHRFTAAHVDFNQIEHIYRKFFVPLDPYYDGHQLGKYGQDCSLHHKASSSYVPELPETNPLVLVPASPPPPPTPHRVVQEQAQCGCGDCAGPDEPSRALHASRANQLLNTVQRQRINRNKMKAMQIRNKRLLGSPVRTYLEVSQPSPGPAPVSNLIHRAPSTDHRRKFCFGTVTAAQAKEHMAR